MLIKKVGSDSYSIPSGTTLIEPNDQLILIVNASKSRKLLAAFGVK